MNLLVVEDDPKLARFLARVMREEGFTTDVVDRGDEAVEQALLGRYGLVILDWMLPELDGLSVCRRVRRAGSSVPILMLTARSEVAERVLGLEAGADDFVPKPFEVDELVARVHALLRRSQGFRDVRAGPLQIDRLAHRAMLDGRELDLTPREIELLTRLALADGRPVSRSDLLRQVWRLGFDPGSNLVEVHVSRLRDKLGERAELIETIRGVGYRLRVEEPS